MALVFIFMDRLRFPSGFPVIGMLLNRYDASLVRNVRKSEKIVYKHRKSQLDLDILQNCQHGNVIPKLFHIKLPNISLRCKFGLQHLSDKTV